MQENKPKRWLTEREEISVPILVQNDPDHGQFLPMLLCDVCSEVIHNIKTAWVIYPNTEGDHDPQFVHIWYVSEVDRGNPEVASCDLKGFFPLLNLNCDMMGLIPLLIEMELLGRSQMPIDEYSAAIEAVRQFVEELTKSHPDLAARSEEYRAGYRDALIIRTRFLGSRSSLAFAGDGMSEHHAQS
jgi:hypothetical protein